MEDKPLSNHPTTEKRLDDLTVLHIDLQEIINNNGSNAYRALLERVERPFFIALMSISQGNRTQAARIAGLDVGTLKRYLKRYDIAITKRVLVGGGKR